MNEFNIDVTIDCASPCSLTPTELDLASGIDLYDLDAISRGVLTQCERVHSPGHN